VYEPLVGTNIGDFLQQFRQANPMNGIPWLICGDFNLVLEADERSTNRLTVMDREFRRVVNGLELIDLPLQGRRYTWSNSRENATFVRLDSFLISQQWSMDFPTSSQKALTNSNHQHETATKFL
jgi:hypothetical protein